MAQLVTLPSIVADATDAVIESWLVEAGAEISHGQALADIETEKATVELEAESAGTLARILVEAGTTVEVGTPIAVLAEPGDSEAEIDGLLAGANAETASSSTAGCGSSAEVEQERTAAEGLERSNASKTETAVAAVDTVLNASVDTVATSDMTRVFASPLARRRARELGVAVTGLKGSGPGGRIIRSDVETAAGTAAEAAESGSASAPTHAQPSVVSAGDTADAGYTDVPLTGMRRAIARRLTESKSTVPHFYLTGDIRMDALLEFRKQINVSLERQGVKATINDLVLKALGHALHEVPDANAIWNENSIRRFDSVDISMAIATEGGLLTPVVRNVSNLSVAACAGRPRTSSSARVRKPYGSKSSKAVPSASPTLGCSALASSQRSSTLRRQASSPWEPPNSEQWSATANSPSRR